MPFLAALGPILLGAGGASAAATTAAWGAIGAGAAAGASLYGAHATSSAARDAAAQTSAASTHAADLQKQSADEALAFEKAQAARDYATQEATRHANYDQWVAGQQRLSSLGEMVGLGPRTIPGYVPLPPYDANAAAGTPGAAPSTGSAGLPTIDPSKPLAPQLDAYFQSRGAATTETPYWVQKWPELVARGQQLNDPQYAAKRLSQAEIFGGGAGAPATAAPAAAHPAYAPPVSGSLASMLPLPITPALVDRTPYAYTPGTLGSYIR